MAMGTQSESFAIIGFAFKFPQDATSPEGFWRILEEGRCVMTDIPATRMNLDGFHVTHQCQVDQLNVCGGHFLKEELGAFDAPFFSISSAEAAAMDPQQRGLLEISYHALESAGIPIEAVSGSSTAVFTSSFGDDHRIISLKDPECMSCYAGSGTAPSMLANRLSWWYKLKGPSLSIDTACSSSLVALHLACQSLRIGESSMALVGGSNIMSSPEQYLLMSNLSMLSPSSRSYSFDHRANGYGRGEGFGMVVVKRLSDAINDGNIIRAVIRATGTNHNGRTPNLTSPCSETQQKLIRDTYRQAGLDLATTAFVEAHGTGTTVGDPLEAQALGSVFGTERAAGDPLYVGSVKSNIGHLEGASGLAGLIKVIMMLERGIIPPNANFEESNPEIDTERLNIAFPRRSIVWPAIGLRRASVNSFGFGGSNCHVVLDDAFNFLKTRGLHGRHLTVDLDTCEPNRGTSPIRKSTQNLTPVDDTDYDFPKLLIWSGSDSKASSRLLKTYSDFFTLHHRDADFASIDELALLLCTRRSLLPSRCFAVISSPSQLFCLPSIASKPVRAQGPRYLGFIFTGQGAQYGKMGEQLLSYPIFTHSLEMSQEYLRELGCKWCLIDELRRSDDETNMHTPLYSQPLCTALQIALVELLRGFGVRPQIVVGHSSGEIAAAYSIGALDHQSAMKVAYLRGQAVDKLVAPFEPRGAMLAAGLSEDEASRHLTSFQRSNPPREVVIACINSPSSVTLAGDEVAIDALEAQLRTDGIFVRKLRVSVAYHSPHMEKASSEYRRLIGTLRPGKYGRDGFPAIISSVTGGPVSADQMLDPDYWIQNMVSPVIFKQAVVNLLSGPTSEQSYERLDILEIGPHPALQGPFLDIVASLNVDTTVHYDSVLRRNKGDISSLLSAMGRLHCLGHRVDLEAINRQLGKVCTNAKALTNLPLYPFDHSKTYWHESKRSRDFRLRKIPRSYLLGSPICYNDPPQMARRWRKITRSAETPWILDHVVNGTAIYPAAGMLAMAIEAGNQHLHQNMNVSAFCIKEAVFLRPICISGDEEGVETHIELGSWSNYLKSTYTANFKICTLEGESWIENCRGVILVEYGDEAQWSKQHVPMSIRPFTREIEVDKIYELFDSMGLKFGTEFRSLAQIAVDSDHRICSEAVTFSSMYEQSRTRDHIIHPVTLDSIFQTILVALTQASSSRLPTTVPTKVHDLWVKGTGVAYPIITSLRVTAKVEEQSSRNTRSTASAYDESGNLLVHVGFLETTFIDSIPDARHKSRTNDTCFHVAWKPDIDMARNDTPSTAIQTTPGLEYMDGHFQDLSILFYHICIDVLSRFDPAQVDLTSSYLHHYVHWMKQYVAQNSSGPNLRSECSPAQTDQSLIIELCEKVSKGSAIGRGLAEIGENLLAILHGDLNPLELLFKSSVAEQYYQEANARLEAGLQHIMELIAFKNPGLRVLEIGAGTGSTTELVLKYASIQVEEGANLSAISIYDFTDISQAFFPSAKKRFSAIGSQMRFSVLDISKDPMSQGFKEGHYDLIVAANVLHATLDLNVTLSNVRNLLKPNGKLVILEITNNEWIPQVIFGTLPGWWLANDEYRTLGPCISTTSWNLALSRNRFSGADIVLHDSADPRSRICSVLVASAVEDVLPETIYPDFVILSDPNCLMAHEISESVRIKLSTRSAISVKVKTLPEAYNHDFSNTFCISLIELKAPLLVSMSDNTFATLRAIFSTVSTLLWVRDRGDAIPSFHLSDGLLRVLQSENAASRYVTLATTATSSESVIDDVMRVVNSTLHQRPASLELEYKEVQGRLTISRAVPAVSINHHLRNAVRHENTFRFDPKSTYVIAGGFGGVARSICRWMVRQGARHLILLSRSGPASSAAQDLLKELASQNVNIECPLCDISSFDNLRNTLSSCTSRLPPIKGCIQGALVLQDSVFENMTHKQWTRTLGPRVTGTQNLFDLLPDISFFVLLSSVAGMIGNPSQANYAATNTYLDAFAHCHSTATKTVAAIDVGWVEFAGTVAESKSVQERLASLGCLAPMSERELLAILEYYCAVEKPPNEVPVQTITGIKNTKGHHSAGPSLLDRPLWRALCLLDQKPTESHAPGSESATRVPISSMLSKASSVVEAARIVLQAISEKLIIELGLEQDAIEPDKPLHEAGVDSLMAVQLRSWFRSNVAANISVFNIMGNTSLGDLCKAAAEKSEWVGRSETSNG